jgi:hypothetical protein
MIGAQAVVRIIFAVLERTAPDYDVVRLFEFELRALDVV